MRNKLLNKKQVLVFVKNNKLLLFFFAFFVGFYFCLPSPLFDEPNNTLIEDCRGELLGAKITSDGQWRFPPSRTVPDKFAKSIIAFEDRRFYQHPGYDMIAVGRAAIQNIKSGKISEGGSTLTMQVVRLARKRKDRTFWQKIVELVLAVRLEAKYSKDEILLHYASNAPFGGNVVGLDAAAWRYFGRDAEDLSWAESATLAVLPNAPAMIHPGRNRDALLKKRNRLLDQLHEQGYVDEETCRLSKLEELPDAPVPLPMIATHLLNDVSVKYPSQRTVTTIQETLQERATAVVKRHVDIYKANKVNNAAVLVLDVETGEVLAYVGNAYDPNDTEHGSNVDIIKSPRSTGSVLKPFLYAAMLDEGTVLPNTLISDIPLHIAGFAPQNYNKTFDGAVPAHLALERSLNIPAVRMLRTYNVKRFHVLLKQMGMTTLTKSAGHYGLSLILGGAEGTLWDVTGIYASMARTLNHYEKNDGLYDLNDWHSPSYLPAEERKEKLEKKGYLSAAAIWQTFNALTEVKRPEDDASWKMYSSSRRIAWKTGTSFGNRDAWAIGVTPNYAVGVWVGNANGEGRPHLTGINHAAPILFDIFGLLPNSRDRFPFPQEEMVKVAVCHKSGYRAGELCETVDSMYIKRDGLESEVCPYHILVHVDNEEKYRVNSDCMPVSEIVHKSWFVLPPAQEWYYKSKHADYSPLPPVHPNCLGSEGRQQIDIIYPADKMAVVIPVQLDGSEGKVVFQAAHRRPNSRVFWHLDDEFVGTTYDKHTLAFTPDPGEHKLILVDEEGNTVSCMFTVEGNKRAEN